MERKKNSTTMIGRKLSTLPTPVKMPSMTNECTAALTFQLVRAVSTTPVRASMPISMRFWKNRPMTLKVRKNTRPMMAIKAGMAVYLPVRNLSMWLERSCSLLSWGFTTVCATSS